MYSHETKDASIPSERAGSRAPASGGSSGLCEAANADFCGFKQPARYKNCQPWTDINTGSEEDNRSTFRQCLQHAWWGSFSQGGTQTDFAHQTKNSFISVEIKLTRIRLRFLNKFSRKCLKLAYNLLLVLVLVGSYIYITSKRQLQALNRRCSGSSTSSGILPLTENAAIDSREPGLWESTSLHIDSDYCLWAP